MERRCRAGFGERAPHRNGGRHCCQPPLRRAKDMPVFVTWSKTRRPRPALDPGSPAQASHPIKQLPPGEEPDFSTPVRCPRVRCWFDPSGPAQEPKSPAKTVQCSAALLGSTTLASRFASRPSEEALRAASRLRKIDSSGASSRLAPSPLRRASTLPAGGDRTFGHLPRLLAVAGLPERLGPPSRSQLDHALRLRVGKAKNAGTSLWITGISVTTDGTFFGMPVRLPEAPAPPTSAKCLNLQS